MISLSKYKKIKDNYCVCYFGNCHEYLVQLKLLRPAIERRFPDLNIYYACRDEFKHLFGDCDKIVLLSNLKKEKDNFAHVKELRYDNLNHPVLHFLNNSDITDLIINDSLNEEYTVKGVIITKGMFPTKGLVRHQITVIERILIDKGFEVFLDVNIENAGWVIGVESANLFEAAGRKIRTSLIPTGIGTDLYKKMFPHAEILNV